jgi:hypothetical protein
MRSRIPTWRPHRISRCTLQVPSLSLPLPPSVGGPRPTPTCLALEYVSKKISTRFRHPLAPLAPNAFRVYFVSKKKRHPLATLAPNAFRVYIVSISSCLFCFGRVSTSCLYRVYFVYMWLFCMQNSTDMSGRPCSRIDGEAEPFGGTV